MEGRASRRVKVRAGSTVNTHHLIQGKFYSGGYIESISFKFFEEDQAILLPGQSGELGNAHGFRFLG